MTMAGTSVPDPNPLINMQNLDFEKPKLFFKNIGCYMSTSCMNSFQFYHNIEHKDIDRQIYDKLLDQHQEPFRAITKSVTDVSLATIESSLEDFRDIIKALPPKSVPGRPKHFIAIGILIAAMAMSTFNTVWITKLDVEIHTLKEKIDLMLDVVHLHE
jgi:hypothetical protein